MRHQHHGTIRLLGADTAQRTKRNLTTAQIKTGSRLVQNQQIRISHQRTADQHARTLAFRKFEHHFTFEIFDTEFTHQERALA